MKTIDLTQEKIAFVDDEDHEFISRFAWHAIAMGNLWYAYRSIKLLNGRWTERSMHKHILETPKGMLIDHKDGNGLNNQKHNLRLANHQQNMANRKKHKNNTSGYKGVTMEGGRWRARIVINNKSISLGYYDDPAEAAIVYDMAATKMFGEFARLNFHSGEQQ